MQRFAGALLPAGQLLLSGFYTEDIPLRDGENEVPMPPFIFTKPGYQG